MQDSQGFWDYLDRLVGSSRTVIDRPKGSAHPRYPTVVYPVNYGYLENTSAIDGGGIDVWVGSTGTDRPDAILCTVDLLKRDAEIKLLIGCSEGEKEAILRFLNANAMRGILIRRA
jgi:inorganic pyrophosphatase